MTQLSNEDELLAMTRGSHRGWKSDRTHMSSGWCTLSHSVTVTTDNDNNISSVDSSLEILKYC